MGSIVGNSREWRLCCENDGVCMDGVGTGAVVVLTILSEMG